MKMKSIVAGEELNKHSCFRSDPIFCFMFVSCLPCNRVQFIRQKICIN